MNEDALQMSQEMLSLSLYQVMELAGASIETRNLQKKCMTTFEFIESVFYDHFYDMSSYVFGSQYEGTTLIGSDLDQVRVFKSLEVVTNSQDCPEQCLLLIQDELTLPGYCKLQYMLNGVPLLRHHSNDNTVLHFNIETDLNGRLLLGNNTVSETFDWPFQLEFHGPAISLSGIKGKVFDKDTVFAFRCRCLPKENMEWFTRKRLYGWPPKEKIEKCKTLGFLVVPVGHPKSIEKDKEWRISFSEQERLLVVLFNSVQLKCYVMLKILKNEAINNKLNAKILTSYHCKTCMFYMIETTPTDFWAPSNLLKCIKTCIEKIHEWAKEKHCPNYFIPGENMFDKLAKKDVELLANALQTLLSGNLINVLLKLNTNDIGDHLRNSVHRYNLLPQDVISLLTYCDHSGEIYLWHVMKTVLRTVSRKIKFRQRLSHLFLLIRSLLSMRNVVLIEVLNHDTDLEKVAENLRFIVNQMESKIRVAEHSEEETKRSLSLFLPLIKPMLLSNQIALQRQTGTPEKEICKVLTCDMFHSSKLEIDYSQLKRSCILYKLGYHQNSLSALTLMDCGGRVSICRCDMKKRLPENLDKVLVNRQDIYDDVEAKDLLLKVVSPCVPFLLTEANITPSVIMYECLGNLCLPTKPNERYYNVTYKCEIAYVDGHFLFNVLLYLNHTKMQQRDLTWIDILLMNALVNARESSHPAACLNILGWAFMREGLKSNARKCFIQSIREETERNAAYWHLLFLMSEKSRGTA